MLKALLVAPLRAMFRLTQAPREALRRVIAHAELAAQLQQRLPASVVVLGRSRVFGTADVRFGENTLLYPDLHLETQGSAHIELGAGVVVSRGVHLVAMHGIVIGEGSMIGEYTSIRDANHARQPGTPLRDAGHTARPIHIGREVWIGRGVAILAGVRIGDYATIGANAVVTRDIPPYSTAVGIPAKPLPGVASH